MTDAPDLLRVTSAHGFGTFDLKEGHLSLEHQLSLPDSDRMNDGKLDPTGQYVAGSINEEDGKTAGLFRLRHDGSIDVLHEDLTNSNGLVWSEDGKTLYHIDTPTKKSMPSTTLPMPHFRINASPLISKRKKDSRMV